ncbi:MAG: glycosyltransferase [Paludibacteraceae bacterium]|nr:glycosyltransferase [Paludibacteraceae bacterium]
MKKVLICLRDFKQGGIPRCLQSLLMNIDEKKYSIDLVCLYPYGPYRGEMMNCNVVREDRVVSGLLEFSKVKGFVNCLRGGYLRGILLKGLRVGLKKIVGIDILCKRIDLWVESLGEYDVAIAYAEGLPAYFVKKTDAKKKLVWIHNDYDWISSAGDGTDFYVFDKICGVSEATSCAFERYRPDLRDKVGTIYNFINEDYIRGKAEECANDLRAEDGEFVLCSIGRVCNQKRFEIIPAIARELKETGLSFRWYIIGDGPQDEVAVLNREIERCGVQDVVIKLGAQDNPYKYLAKADLYVLTSRYESYPTVVNEALILNVPVVSVNIPSAYEMIELGVNGEIVAVEDMTKMIQRFIEDREFYLQHKGFEFHNKNREILEQLDKLLNN